MNLRITVEVQIPDTTPPQEVIDEIQSNIESCDWAIVSTTVEILEDTP